MSDRPATDETPYFSRLPRTRSGWLHDCKVCGKGAAFGFSGPHRDTFYCSEHRHLGKAVPPPPMPRTSKPQ